MLIIGLPEYISISSKLKSESTSILICLRLMLVSSNPTLSSPEKIVFIQLELCKSKEILSDNYDIEADYIITG